MKPQITNVTRPGENHTGIALHPEFALEMVEGTTEFGPTSSGGPEQIAANRVRVAKVSEPAATMPSSPQVAAELLPMLDKLGARLAFERIGVRLYEALISKYDAYGTFRGGPTREDFVYMRDQELRHLGIAHHAIQQLGGDPTAVTPCANVQAVASRGVVDILVDPRTNLVECLEALVIAELTDHESWEHLVPLVAPVRDKDLEARIREAERTEAEHLTKVRGWLAAAAKLTASGD
ncbi:MAG TPA: ferritin-like domain-containing protein [Kofleriaceae bacterium]|nr:ferritin-like domain-containing protein [Kofleriaceae bacterium]